MNETYKWPMIIVGVIILAAVAYGVMTMPDRRSSMEKLGDAIHDLPQGADKAERQLEDRTPGQKLGDAVKDTGDKIKDETGAQPNRAP